MGGNEKMKNLKLLREQNDLTQAELAKLLHVSQQAIHKYELGLSEASFATLQNISNIFNVPVNYLINDDISIEDYKADNHIVLNKFEEDFIISIRKLNSDTQKLLFELSKKLSQVKNNKY